MKITKLPSTWISLKKSGEEYVRHVHKKCTQSLLGSIIKPDSPWSSFKPWFAVSFNCKNVNLLKQKYDLLI